MKTATSTKLIACIVIAGAFAVGFVSGPAFADQAPGAPFKFQFSYSPNELTSAPRAEALLVRLEQSVRRHCSGTGRVPVDERRFVDACIDATMKASIAKFDSPAVAQAFQSRAAG